MDLGRWRGDLLAHRGASAIIPGDAQPPAVHALAHAINASLGNAGTTVVYTDPIEIAPEDQLASLRELVSAMQDGKVHRAAHARRESGVQRARGSRFRRQTRQGPAAIHVSLHPNETSAHAHWLVPERHFLEDWGDARAFDGTVTILQPLIQPLYHVVVALGGAGRPRPPPRPSRSTNRAGVLAGECES